MGLSTEIRICGFSREKAWRNLRFHISRSDGMLREAFIVWCTQSHCCKPQTSASSLEERLSICTSNSQLMSARRASKWSCKFLWVTSDTTLLYVIVHQRIGSNHQNPRFLHHYCPPFRRCLLKNLVSQQSVLRNGLAKSCK